ncbi:MAG TPA: DUF4375 domain-containing protein [Verrucomicrobiae bacterium]|jgi:hypothetical protein
MRTKTEDEILVEKVSKELYKRLGDASIFELPWVSQVVTVFLGAQGYIDNGGFIYFFEGDYPGTPPYSVFANAYRAIGADESAECIEVAAKLFPFPEPHLHGDARRDYLRDHCMINGRSNDESLLVKLGDRVIDNSEKNYFLLAKYIREHLDEIRKT